MDWLWSPWRYRYVSHLPDPTECIFCDKGALVDGRVDETKDLENLILYRGKLCYALLNLFPYTTGHLMVTPYAHGAELSELPVETME